MGEHSRQLSASPLAAFRTLIYNIVGFLLKKFPSRRAVADYILFGKLSLRAKLLFCSVMCTAYAGG